MRFISHRGNIDGPNPRMENNPQYIDKAISSGFDVEIDLWVVDSKLFLGHDSGEHIIDKKWIFERSCHLWLHAKNIPAICWLSSASNNGLNFFWHQNDDISRTSSGILWTYPGIELTSMSVCVMPEIADYTHDEIGGAWGICSDLIKLHKDRYENI